MFETAELGRKVSKADYDAQVPEIRTRLLDVQNQLRAAKVPVLIIISGVDGAGKGETANLLHEWMDPRFIETTAFAAPSEEERERPEYWRFWRPLPPKGKIGIFFGSWYTSPIVRRVLGQIKEGALSDQVFRITSLERELVADGMLIIKFWFHLSKSAQEKRLRGLEKDPDTAWRVTEMDWKNFRIYDKFRDVSERVLKATSTGEAPWHIIEASDARYRSLTVGNTLLDLITKRLEAAKAALPPPPKPVKASTSKPASAGVVKSVSAGAVKSAFTILDTVDLAQTIEESKYKKELERLSGKFNLYSRRAKAQGRSTVMLFEGWDAAGKGGLIRRIASALDARDYAIIPIAAPTDEEKARHYLWRFWRHLPRTGRLTVFDRTWYGRVLVERVEGFAKEAEWRRAYSEINDFEAQLVDHGYLLFKFWLHISKEEQLRRFKEREATPFKRFKITDEDWRNREKWDAYEIAANEMVERTSTGHAPWVLLAGNDKKFARIQAFRNICERMKNSLKT
ncbi:MAG: polyphosphate:AMP phosphotransferase [Candidatus Brocadiia bacterium]